MEGSQSSSFEVNLVLLCLVNYKEKEQHVRKYDYLKQGYILRRSLLSKFRVVFKQSLLLYKSFLLSCYGLVLIFA